MNELLKTHFTNYICNNGSNRDINDINKLENLCKNNNKFIIYFIKNETNESLFNFLDGKSNQCNISNVIFLHNRDYFYFNVKNNNNYIECINILKKEIGVEMKCVICYENCIISNKTSNCDKCNSYYHKKCYIEKKYCPQCNKK